MFTASGVVKSPSRNVSPNYALLAIVLAVPLASLLKFWPSRVNENVTEPYLDEFFHVRQAQLYCAGNFSYWDPKITTPPGLYILSYLWHIVGGRCDLSTLRQLNSVSIATGILLPTLWLFIARDGARGKAGTGWFNIKVDREVVRSLHAALNICLFPPLFFFSGLYYTDITSTAAVLLFLSLRESEFLASRRTTRGFVLIVVGLIALGFRQTNIFWVAVFPAALELVNLLKSKASRTSRAGASRVSHSAPATALWNNILSQSWEHGVIYDPPFNDAYLEDFALFALSVLLSTLRDPLSLATALTPYIALLIAFAAFIILNGGVVLGDKTNHIATLHTPQLLYLWPYIFFFSWQQIIPRFRALVVPPRHLPRVFLPFRPQNPWKAFPRLLVVAVWMVVAVLAVRYNTIVHPFTLADNRHYVFYVFRILLRHPVVRYLAVPVYIFCAWTALLALGLPAQAQAQSQSQPPASTTSRSTPTTTTGVGIGKKTDDIPTGPSHNSSAVGTNALYDPGRGCATSYILIWLATTTLTLITAPLVEPRYVILPWIMWRYGVASVPCHVSSAPAQGSQTAQGRGSCTTTTSPTTTTTTTTKTIPTSLRELGKMLQHGEHRLYVETAWFVLVNAVTGYMFLYRGFEWVQEEGRVQRFMW